MSNLITAIDTPWYPIYRPHDDADDDGNYLINLGWSTTMPWSVVQSLPCKNF